MIYSLDFFSLALCLLHSNLNMTSIFRRALSSLPGPSSTTPTLPSLARTAPQAVTRRREVDAEHNRAQPANLLPPRLEAEFQALRSAGQYKGDEASGRKAFYDRQVVWRSRVRGVKGSKQAAIRDDGDVDSSTDAEPTMEVLGQSIYLPNIQIRLMRNHTPPGEAYDPNVATFRIPHNMTKPDLRSYLSALYGMTVTFIRTDNYFPAVKRMPGGGQVRVPVGSQKSYKRAIVGLTEPFHYPDDVDELYAQGERMGLGQQLGDERKEWIENNFQVGMLAEMKKKALMKFHKGYRWRSKTHDNPVRPLHNASAGVHSPQHNHSVDVGMEASMTTHRRELTARAMLRGRLCARGRSKRRLWSHSCPRSLRLRVEPMHEHIYPRAEQHTALLRKQLADGPQSLNLRQPDNWQ